MRAQYAHSVNLLISHKLLVYLAFININEVSHIRTNHFRSEAFSNFDSQSWFLEIIVKSFERLRFSYFDGINI